MSRLNDFGSAADSHGESADRQSIAFHNRMDLGSVPIRSCMGFAFPINQFRAFEIVLCPLYFGAGFLRSINAWVNTTAEWGGDDPSL